MKRVRHQSVTHPFNLYDTSCILEQLGECLGCLACIGYHLCNWLVAEILEGKELSGYKLMVVREACLQLHITHTDG